MYLNGKKIVRIFLILAGLAVGVIVSLFCFGVLPVEAVEPVEEVVASLL